MVNPAHPDELAPFMRKLNEEMPIHTDSTAKIKRSFSQGMPKNLMEYSAHVDNKFLNDNLAIIEEIAHRDQIHPIPKFFREYQIKHFAKFGILNKDRFFTTRMRDGYRKHFAPDLTEIRAIGFGAGANYHNMGILSVIPSTKVFGSDLTSGGTGAGGHQNFNKDTIQANKLSDGVIGQFYDRVAEDIFSGSDNYRLGVYDDNTGPNNLYAQTGSTVASAGFNWVSVTEFGLNTVTNWLANINDTDGVHNLYYEAVASRYFKAQVYGALPNPAGSGYSTDSTNVMHGKIGHS